jgi:hypothetical protein
LSQKAILQMIFIRVKQLLQQVKIRHKKVCHQGLRSVNLRVQIVLVNYKMTSLYKKTKAVVRQFLIKNSLIILKVMSDLQQFRKKKKVQT